MKTYLSNNEFVELFWNLYDRKMTANFSAETGDKIIWAMFQEFEKDVKETLEGSMHGLDEFNGGNANELIGYQFHKAFRQCDPINARYINGIIWTCMQDAPVFWKCMDKACNILTSEELSNHYKEELAE